MNDGQQGPPSPQEATQSVAAGSGNTANVHWVLRGAGRWRYSEVAQHNRILSARDAIQ